MTGPILTGSNQQPCWHTHNRLAEFIIDLDSQVFSRRFPWHIRPARATLSRGGLAKVIGIYFPDPLSVWAGFRACFFETGLVSACLAFSDARVFP